MRHSQKTWLIAGGALDIVQTRRLGHHLHDRVVETYSHVAREVETRLLADLQRRWKKADRPELIAGRNPVVEALRADVPEPATKSHR
ncbi:hypothetical protein [Amycolatopsis sp. NPDC059657]|uniref:hypothetical protein n=1 Tax=Amycolatopsis sp. NPDC059657 TaxID=3346899 RepID=UPI00367189E0